MLDFVQKIRGARRCRRPSRGWTAAQCLRPGPLLVQPERGGRSDAALPPRDPALLTAAARFYAGMLRRSTEARGYLASRGVGPVAAARLGLGYAPGGGLRQALESLGFSEKRIRDSGLFMERGAERFAGMIVVPDPVSSTGQAGGLVRWLEGPGHGSESVKASLPGPSRPQAGARTRQARPRSARGSSLHGGGLRLAPPRRMGPPRLRCPRHPGHGAHRLGPPGLPPRLPRLRQRRCGARGDGRASDPARTQGRRRRPPRMASATWPSLRPSPTGGASSSVCSRRPPAPPASGSPPLSCGHLSSRAHPNPQLPQPRRCYGQFTTGLARTRLPVGKPPIAHSHRHTT